MFSPNKMNRLLKLLSIIYLCCSFSVKAETPKTLTIYATDSFSTNWGAGGVIKEAFEKKFNCKLKFISFDHASSIISRLNFEGNKGKADLVLGLDFTQSNLLNVAKLFEPHNIPVKQLNLPMAWQDKIFLPYCYGYLTFIYNAEKELVLPKNFQELIDSSNNLRIIMADPRSSSLGFDFLIWTNEVFHNKFKERWQALSKKVAVFTQGWAEAWSLFTQSEGDLVLSYDTSAGYHIINGKRILLKPLILEDGHMIQFQVVAKLKSAQEKNLADQFLNFLIEPETQQLIAKYNRMHPVVVKDHDMRSEENEYHSHKIPLNYSINRKELTKKWINAIL
jgi:thiamine transport system substrate-binding protein